MKHCRQVLLFTILLLPVISLAQKKEKIDSLLRVLPSSKDTNKANVLYRLSTEYWMIDLVQAEKYALEALSESEKIDYKKGIGHSNFSLGEIYWRQGENSKALKYHGKAVKFFQEAGMLKAEANSYNNIAGVYYTMGDLPAALDYMQKAARIREKINDKVGIAAVYNNIAILHFKQGEITDNKAEYDRALDYNIKALKIREELRDSDAIASSYSNIGALYQSLGQDSLSLIYFEKALPITIRSNSKTALAILYGNIGSAYTRIFDRTGDAAILQKAQDTQQKCLDLHTEVNNHSGIAGALNNLGFVYESKKDFRTALLYHEKALAIAQQIGNKELVKNIHLNISKIYQKMNDPAKALEHYQLFTLTKDSILNEEKSEQLAELDKKYETEKKEREIELLNKNQAIQDAEIEQQSLVRNFLFGIVGFILLLGVVLFNAYRNKQKANVLLNMQKLQIEKQKQEITDSITYARNIQQALLPPPGEITSALKQSFVLYKPKDIVSGDFYWFHPVAGKNNLYLLAAADCTGHGVPGAFMSMIGVEKLNEIAKSTFDPGDILTALNRSVKKALHQGGAFEGKTRDGMDIALCSIDPVSRKIRFAGANRPLFVVKGEKGQGTGEESFIEIRSTKTAIGGFTSESQLFETHEISLQEGDCVYLFSDGYADQFGGGSGKKMMTRKFREQLLSIAPLPLNEQQSRLESFFNEWKGDYEQLDDVLVIGIRV